MGTEQTIGTQTGMDGSNELYERGLAYAEECERDEAIAAFRECLRLNPSHSQAHCQLVSLLSDQGFLAEAEREYREALGLKANYLEAYKGLAECLDGQGREEEAKICWKRAFEIEKNPSERERIAFQLSEDG